MTRGLSIWLDVLRVLATLTVVLSHIAYARFTRGDYAILRDLNVGSDAVVVFFVISGLVIAFAAGRDGRFSTYGFNRLTRLLSVLAPALLLTFALDRIGLAIGPEAYATHYNPLSLSELMARGLTMSNEWAAVDRLRLGSNGPLWSLSYEAAYYALFAAAVFLSGARRVAVLALLAWIFGPRILLLMPAWLMGVWVWRWIEGGGAGRMALSRARAFALGAPLLYVMCQWAGVPAMLSDMTAQGFAPRHYKVLLVFSDEFVWNTVLGGLAALHVMGMARLLRGYQGDHPHVRWWAGASFSIYVTHYPVLHLIDAAFPAETFVRDGMFLGLSVVTGLVFAAIFERPIGPIRKALLRLHAGLRPHSHPV